LVVKSYSVLYSFIEVKKSQHSFIEKLIKTRNKHFMESIIIQTLMGFHDITEVDKKAENMHRSILPLNET